MLLSNWRTYAVLLLLALGGWGGWSANKWLNPVTPPLPPVTNTVTVEKVVTHTVTKVVQPDGTVTETTTETTASTNTSTSKPAPVYKPKWSAETIASMRPEWKLPRPDWSALVYHRLGDTNAWVGGGYSFSNKAILAAVRVDF